ncbi:hypothetical protein ISF_08017 [Cordyceps fumosorosea ARSEF 2679]|uniref:Uncharacterized protein n=1 Tax=Cordyceps fumosorosea (strain ARSEF 2679) TaxID=1081104 RepID=A0A167N3S5_CORFA|nr:hypothetical protein ISF_08017 [Cordyceps fumosorosea ARSEF 2679]OAA55096.1 hypothetical protein ISF_08017 [Cordyceps fumosorosea ARSEF 2679]
MFPPFPPYVPIPGQPCLPLIPPPCPFPDDGDFIAPFGFPVRRPPAPRGRHQVDIETCTDYRPRHDGGFNCYERTTVTSDNPIAAIAWSHGQHRPPEPRPSRASEPRPSRASERRMLDAPPPSSVAPSGVSSCQCSRLSDRFDRGRAPSVVPSEVCSRCSRRSSVRSLNASPPRPLLLDAPYYSAAESSAASSSRRRSQPTSSSRVFDLGDIASSLAETERTSRAPSGASRNGPPPSSATRSGPPPSSATRNGPPPSSTTRGCKRHSYSSSQKLSTVEEDRAPPPSYTSQWVSQRAGSRDRRGAARTNSTIRPESSISQATAKSSRRSSGCQRH